MCGSKVPGDKFYVQRKPCCGDYIESQYYNHLGGKEASNSIKGGRLVTENICAICYSFQDVLSDAEINMSRNIRGKNPLLICRDFFNSILKSRLRADPVTYGKSRDKGGQQRRGN